MFKIGDKITYGGFDATIFTIVWIDDKQYHLEVVYGRNWSYRHSIHYVNKHCKLYKG